MSHNISTEALATVFMCKENTLLNNKYMLNGITSTFLNSDFNDRQVGCHVLQHTHFSNQVATGKKRAEAGVVKPSQTICISICAEDKDVLVT